MNNVIKEYILGDSSSPVSALKLRNVDGKYYVEVVRTGELKSKDTNEETEKLYYQLSKKISKGEKV